MPISTVSLDYCYCFWFLNWLFLNARRVMNREVRTDSTQLIVS